MREFIYVSSAGTSDFKDSKHFDNFLKYLFSESKSHTANTQTPENAYSLLQGKLEYVKDGKMQVVDARKKLWNYSSRAKNLKNTLYYIGYYFNVGDFVVTNIFENNNDEWFIKIDTSFGDLISGRSVKVVKEVFSQQTDKKIRKIEDFNELYKNKLHEKIFAAIRERFKIEDDLICMAHLDQESMYHLHFIHQD